MAPSVSARHIAAVGDMPHGQPPTAIPTPPSGPSDLAFRRDAASRSRHLRRPISLAPPPLPIASPPSTRVSLAAGTEAGRGQSAGHLIDIRVDREGGGWRTRRTIRATLRLVGQYLKDIDLDIGHLIDPPSRMPTIPPRARKDAIVHQYAGFDGRDGAIVLCAGGKFDNCRR